MKVTTEDGIRLDLSEPAALNALLRAQLEETPLLLRDLLRLAEIQLDTDNPKTDD